MVFTGGGSGGHVYPGLAVARKLQSVSDVRVLWLGSRTGIERGIVEAAKLPYVGIAAGKLRRYFSLRTLVDSVAVVAALVRSVLFMLVRRPALVFAKGGYVTVPPAMAAALTGIPVVTHESDSDPGLATRINARFASRILVPYPRTIEAFPAKFRSRITVTGNPVREDIRSGDRNRGLEHCGFEKHGHPVILVLGGSLGARRINEAVLRLLPALRESWRIVHQTGDRSNDLPLPGNDSAYFRSVYLGNELADVLAMADLILCRSGASTLWECASLGKPMVLVPLQTGSRGDQLRNAELFEDAGAAIVVRSSDPDDGLDRAVDSARDPVVRARLGRNAQELIQIDSTDQIVTILKELMHTQR